MIKICQTGLLKLKFETRPKKRIFRFLPKISAGHSWSWNFFFANFQILGPLGCQGWVVIPQNVKKSKNHCTLLLMLYSLNSFSFTWRCCSLVLLKSLWQKPVLTTHLSWNCPWGWHLCNVLKDTLTMNRTKYRQSQST